MSIDNQALRVAIVGRLKEYDAYIDNELPDYIMVMIANNKTISQIRADLQLFLGDNTELFVEWLEQILAQPELLLESQHDAKATTPTTKADGKPTSRSENVAGSKRRSHDSTVNQPSTTASSTREHSPSPRQPPAKVPRLSSQEAVSAGKLVPSKKIPDPKHRDQEKSKVAADGQKEREEDRERNAGRGRETDRSRKEPFSSKDQDLRALISKRRRKEPSPARESSGSDEEEETGKTRMGLSSVVQRPERPSGRTQGTGRLIQRAIRGIHEDSRSSPRQLLSQRSKKSSEESLKSGSGNNSNSGARSLQELSSRESTTTIQPEITVEDEFLDEFREEQQQKLVLSDELDEGDDLEEHGEVEVRDKREYVAQEQPVEDTKVTCGEKISVVESRRRTKATNKLTLDDVSTVDVGSKVLPSRGDPTDLRTFLNENRKRAKVPSNQNVVEARGSDSSPPLAIHGSCEINLDLGDDEGEGDPRAPRDNSRGNASIRCKYWPLCRNSEDCPYHHPTVNCRKFPNCQYGDKCHYIHPACKYQADCTKPNCPYVHYTPRKPRAGHSQLSIMSIPTLSPIHAMSAIPSFSPAQFLFAPPSGSMGRSRGGRYPNKSALHWKPHVSERKFAVPENAASSMQV